MTLADMVPRSYYITSSKQLQDQLVGDFGDQIVELKGRSSYPCTFWDRRGRRLVEMRGWTDAKLNALKLKHSDCSNGFCRTSENTIESKFRCSWCFAKGGPSPFAELEVLPPGQQYSTCPYYEQVYLAINGRKVVMNFSSFLYQTQLTKKRFDNPRDLLIIDEAHNCESQILDYVSLILTDNHLKGLGIFIPHFDSAQQYAVWFIDTQIEQAINEQLAAAQAEENTRAIDELSQMLFKYHIFMRDITVHNNEWVADYEVEHRGKQVFRKLILRPVFSRNFARNMLLKHASKILIMSATILDVGVMCNALGVPRSSVAAYRMRNRFPKENRPIYISDVAKMTGGKEASQNWLPKMTKAVNLICKKYAGKRGIIHTHNYAIMDHLLANCDPKVQNRFTHQRLYPDKHVLLQQHMKVSDSIIIAPAMHEGVNLVDDLCYDQETEILTEFGWVMFPELVEGTKVAAYDSSTGDITFEQPSRITKTRCDAWAEFDTMTNNLVVTQPHRMLWRRSQNGSLHETTASAAPSGRHWQFITAGNYHNDGLNLSDDQIRLAVAFQADGSWLYDTERSARFSFRRARKVVRFRQLIERLQYTVTEQSTKRGDVKFLVPKHYLVPLRVLGEWDDSKLWKMDGLLRLSLKQRRVLIDELKYWDGSFTNKGTTYDKMVYHSSLPENIDTIQAIAAMSGYRTDYNGHCLTYRDKLYAQFVNTEHNYVLKKYDTTLPCYCVTVSTGWIVVRRRGKVTISGNSRFQIVCKVPFPNFFDDKQLARRVELDPKFYKWLVALKLIQCIGRSVRSETDYADTYILDSAIHNFLRDSASMIPSWFTEAIHNKTIKSC